MGWWRSCSKQKKEEKIHCEGSTGSQKVHVLPKIMRLLLNIPIEIMNTLYRNISKQAPAGEMRTTRY